MFVLYVHGLFVSPPVMGACDSHDGEMHRSPDTLFLLEKRTRLGVGGSYTGSARVYPAAKRRGECSCTTVTRLAVGNDSSISRSRMALLTMSVPVVGFRQTGEIALEV